MRFFLTLALLAPRATEANYATPRPSRLRVYEVRTSIRFNLDELERVNDKYARSGGIKADIARSIVDIGATTDRGYVFEVKFAMLRRGPRRRPRRRRGFLGSSGGRNGRDFSDRAARAGRQTRQQRRPKDRGGAHRARRPGHRAAAARNFASRVRESVRRARRASAAPRPCLGLRHRRGRGPIGSGDEWVDLTDSVGLRLDGRRGHGSQRRRGRDVDVPWRRVAAPPRLRRG